MTAPIALTGIKPSGTPHIGNYFGMIEPSLALVHAYRAFYFIADYHSLTVTRDPHAMQRQTYQVAATWLALGLDPERVVFYRQSDIPAVFELMWILSCFTAKGLLNRAHAYSDVKQELAERLVAKFEDRRRTFTALMQAPAGIDAILRRGAQRARAAAASMLVDIRRKIGIARRREE